MKVLIISHNPISTKSNMGKTFLSLFSEFDHSELCQFYIYPSFPDVRRCSSFYRVTDKEIVRSLFSFKQIGGEVESKNINENADFYENPADRALYRNVKNKSAIRRIARDTAWKLSRGYEKSLYGWLEKEKPDSIFLSPGPGEFIYDIALDISKKLNIPIVTYICDEYYFLDTPKGLLDKLRFGRFKKKFEKLMANSACLAVICDELKEIYTERFGVKAETLMTGASRGISEGAKIVDNPTEIRYFGNIRCNRFNSLCDVGLALDDINSHTGTDYKLKIFTAEKDSEILSIFNGIKSIELCGFVSGEDFEREFSNSQLLLHVEAFDDASIDRVKHSVSTKIADSLASGIPLLAYGPESISSMKHLIRHNCALTATSKEELKLMLETAFSDVERKRTCAENAIETAKKYHDSRKTGLALKDIFEKIHN